MINTPLNQLQCAFYLNLYALAVTNLIYVSLLPFRYLPTHIKAKSKAHDKLRLVGQLNICISKRFDYGDCCNHPCGSSLVWHPNIKTRNNSHESFYLQLFLGNKDRDSVVFYSLVPPLLGRFVRINPRGWYRHIAMRLELYGCDLGMFLKNFHF